MITIGSRALRYCLWIGMVLLACAWGRAAQAVVVDYSAQATGDVISPFNLAGVSATSSGQLAIQNGGGLGVVGGAASPFGPGISGSEFVQFTFDAGDATDVSFTTRFAFNFDHISSILTIEGLSIGGASLGSVGVDIFASFPVYNVSSLFGNVPLSGFSIIGNGTEAGLGSVGTISYTPLSVAVPEPGTLALFAIGIAGFVVSRRRNQSGRIGNAHRKKKKRAIHCALLPNLDAKPT